VILPQLKIDRGRLRTDGDPPYIAVSLIAHPFWYYAAGVLLVIGALAL
jgi:hypothetical protein